MIHIFFRIDEPNLKRKNPFTESSSFNKLTNCTMENEPASEKDATTILSLNDDCFFELFKYLGVLDLSSISDTCIRLKQTSKAYFAYSKKTNLNLRLEILSAGHTLERLVSKTSRVLRNFGEFIIGFIEGCLLMRCENSCFSTCQFYERTLIEMLVRYCTKNLQELDLSLASLMDDSTQTMGPLVKRLHKLSVDRCTIGTTFWNLWPLCSPQLQELRFERLIVTCQQFECFHKPFPKLVKIILHHVHGLHGSDIVKMLEHNQQLKEIDILHDGELISFDDLLPSIVAHVPDIESVKVRLRKDKIKTSIGL